MHRGCNIYKGNDTATSRMAVASGNMLVNRNNSSP